MTTLAYSVPTAGSTLNSVADPEVATALNTILTWANGNIDAINLSAVLAQSAGVNQAGQAVKGATNISTSQSTSSTTYTTLGTPDQVTGLVVPAGGVVVVLYQAQWKESALGAGRAALFVGTNQLKVQDGAAGAGALVTSAAAINAGPGNYFTPLVSDRIGVASCGLGNPGTAFPSDTTTGQAMGVYASGSGANLTAEINGSVVNLGGTPGMVGGPCYIFNLPAGTYTVSVQFKASSGSVTAQNRQLTAWVISPS